MSAGHKLKVLRERYKLTLRKVEQATRLVANVKNDQRFLVSDGWLTNLEKSNRAPSIHKLFSLSVVYGIPLTTLFKLYGVDLAETDKFKALIHPDATQLLSAEILDDFFPASLQDEKTKMLAKRAGIRLDIPLGSRRDQDDAILYGYIGLQDFTMDPLIRPSAIVRIDRKQTRLDVRRFQNEFTRPIYFIEVRRGYACGWCEMNQNELTIVPHPLSSAPVRHFAYPQDAEIVGRVISFDTRCVDFET
jgi:transcriptional regulator with XRE-family HTH domain